MSTPTVGISETALRILTELAEQTGQTVMEVLDQAVDAYRRKVFFDQMNTGYAELRADPEAQAALTAELITQCVCHIHSKPELP